MKVWLIAIGEPVPIQSGERDRLHRMGYFAQFLANHGHDVLWWTSTFNHFSKKHIFDKDTVIKLNERLTIRLIHGCGYQSNVSLARLRDHSYIAKKFAKLARYEKSLPNIIVSALPTVDLCLEAVNYGKERKIPVVLDMRDMWPDIFIDFMPRFVRPFAKILLSSMFRDAYKASNEAEAIIGITEAFVNWGVKRGKRLKSDLDKDFPMGYVSIPPEPDKLNKAKHFWDDYGIIENNDAFIVCYLGTIARWADFKTIISAARKFKSQNKPIRFVICGTGDSFEYYKHMAADNPDVIFTGWMDAAQMYVLMRRSKVGIDPLPDRYDFLATINNKAIEYMSAGLPVVSSPDRGVLCDFLKKHQCGKSYPYQDADALAMLLSDLYDDREKLQRMSDNAAHVFQDIFTAEKIYKDMMEHLKKVALKLGGGVKFMNNFKEMNQEQQPNVYLDLLRVISAFAVIILHNSAIVVHGIKDTTSFNWWVGNVAESFVRWSVPVFILISGALLLDPNRQYQPYIFLKKRFKRIIPPLLFWSIFYISYRIITGIDKFSFSYIIYQLSTGSPEYHMWYLFMLPGLYLFTPFLRQYIKASAHNERYLLIALIFLISSGYCFFRNVAPIIATKFESIRGSQTLKAIILPQTILTMYIPYLGYFLAGYQISTENRLSLSMKKYGLIVLLSSSLVSIGTFLLTLRYPNIAEQLFYDYNNPFVIITALTIFASACHIYRSNQAVPKFLSILLQHLASNTLGIYIIHPFFIHQLSKYGVSAISIEPIIGIPMISLIVFILSYFTVLIIKQIPMLGIIV